LHLFLGGQTLAQQIQDELASRAFSLFLDIVKGVARTWTCA